MYKVTVNNKNDLNVSIENNVLRIDDKEIDWDIIQLPNGTYSLISNGKSYLITLDNIDPVQKTMSIFINNQHFDVAIKEPIDLLLSKMGIEIASSSKVDSLKAPMPGLILKVLVKEGDQIKKGDTVLILEAMKMENALKSPADALVAAVNVKVGDAVEKNEVLIELQ